MDALERVVRTQARRKELVSWRLQNQKYVERLAVLHCRFRL